MGKVIVDSNLTINESKKQNPAFICPIEAIDQITIVTVTYYSFDGRIHEGQIALHCDLADDVKGAFALMLKRKFPIQSVIPICDKKFAWDDGVSTSANNTSGFNYRYVRDTLTLSNHSTGRAIDINPKLNPYFLRNEVFPKNGTYNPSEPGTITADSEIVAYFERCGWHWGGHWVDDRDYQHFEKP